MPNLNKVFLIGNLTREPELRYTPGGTAVCEFGLAINRKFKDKDETTFVDCVAWQKTAELASQYLGKGSPLFVEGRLTYEQWDGKDGHKRSRLRVTVENMQFLGKPQDRPVQANREPQDRRPPPNDQPFEIDDDVPF